MYNDRQRVAWSPKVESITNMPDWVGREHPDCVRSSDLSRVAGQDMAACSMPMGP